MKKRKTRPNEKELLIEINENLKININQNKCLKEEMQNISSEFKLMKDEINSVHNEIKKLEQEINEKVMGKEEKISHCSIQ